MRLFVDTEFTDFINCDLISIALAADDGREFYGERSDYDDASCTAFVREAVIAQLASIRPASSRATHYAPNCSPG
jgi:hypothetical protein